MFIVANGEDRNMTRTQNRFRDTADQMPAHTTRPMRPHHDEIRFECLGRLHEGARDARAVCINDLGSAAYAAACTAFYTAFNTVSYNTPLAQVARMIELPVRAGIASPLPLR